MRLTEKSLKGKNGPHYLILSGTLQHRQGKAEGTFFKMNNPGLSHVLAWGKILLYNMCGGASTQIIIPNAIIIRAAVIVITFT